MELQIPGSGPNGTHAFIVGVSEYPYADGPEATTVGEEFGLTNLTSAAHSASEVAAWLLNEYRNPDAPLASMRIFLSPVPGEQIHPDVATLMGGQEAPATRDAVEVGFNQFRAACRNGPEDNLAFVYIAGHGIQLNKRGALVLLHDFAVADRDKLYGAIDVAACHSAMDETGTARKQVWFSDACRQRPEIVKKSENLSGAPYRPDEGLGQAEASPLFLASSTRESAFADVGGMTIFSQALLWALRGAGAAGPDATCSDWHVPATKLIRVLPARVQKLLESGSEDQNVDVAGRVLEVVTHRFEEPPDVDVEVVLSPADAAPAPTAELAFNGQNAEPVGSAWPLQFRRPAGLYVLQAIVAPPLTTNGTCILDLEPPDVHEQVVVS